MIDLKDYESSDERKYNLSRRSENIPASQFKWDNPEDADGIPILARPKTTQSDPNVKTTYNNFAVIQRNKAGYMCGNVTRNYTEKLDKKIIEKYTSFDNLNHFQSLLKKMMFSCVGWGNTYSLCYIDANKQARIKQIKSWQAKVVYDDNNEPLEGYVYYQEDKTDVMYQYDFLNVKRFEKTKNGKTWTQVDDKPEGLPHGFKGLPLIEWKNNDNCQGNAQTAVSLMDAFDRLMSDNITEWATFRNAYLMLKNVGLLDEEKAEELQKTGIFAIQGENSEIKFITKDVNPEFVKFITSETWAGIWVVASSVDPKALASLSNATAFQIAQLYRNMEEDCKDTEMEWKVSLEYLDRLLNSFWTGLDLKAVSPYSTEEISYEFTRNIPKDVMTWLKSVRDAGGILPQKEILIKSGYSETDAENLVSEAQNEAYEAMPDLNSMADPTVTDPTSATDPTKE